MVSMYRGCQEIDERTGEKFRDFWKIYIHHGVYHRNSGKYTAKYENDKVVFISTEKEFGSMDP